MAMIQKKTHGLLRAVRNDEVPVWNLDNGAPCCKTIVCLSHNFRRKTDDKIGNLEEQKKFFIRSADLDWN